MLFARTRLCIAIVAFCLPLLGCIPKGQFLKYDVSPDAPERAGLVEIKVDQDHQGLDGTKQPSYTVGPYDGLVIDLADHKNQRIKDVPKDAVEVLILMDGHRLYMVKINPKKRRYVLIPKGEVFLENELAISVGYLDPDPTKISTYPTWMGHVIVDQKRVK